MNALLANQITKKLIKCPNCKNGFVGKNKNGEQEGTFIIGDKDFTRSCKCGLKIVITEKEAETMDIDKYIQLQLECFLEGITLEELYNPDDEIHPQLRN